MQPQQQQPAENVSPQGMPAGGVAGGAAQPMRTAGQPGEPPRNPNTTQNTLLISELRDQMVIMNDGSFRAVVACQSINFDLMSEREREGVEYSYQSFLNSLYFPIQIFIRSQRVDIGPYIERLARIRREQDNMLLGVLMDDYINFIAALSQETNIMDKDFYIVVPYYPSGDVNAVMANSRNFFSAIMKPEKQQHIRIDETLYGKAKDEIANRVNAVLSGLFQIGVRGVQLDTKQLAELYYNVYNPDTAVREPLGNFENTTSTFVQKGAGQAPQTHLGGEGK